MRYATDASGTEWEVFVEWEGRKPLHHAFRRLRAHREAKAQKRSETRSDSNSLLDGCDPLSGLGDELGGIALIIFLVVLLLLFGPWMFAVLLGVIELGIILVAITFGLAGRTLFRRPWRVAAVSETGTVWAWRQTGFLKARRLVHEIADGISAGGSPTTFAADRLESGVALQLDADPDLGPMMKPGVRLAVITFNLIATIVAILLLIQRLS